MSDVSREQMHRVLLHMGYKLIAEEDDLVRYIDTVHPGDLELPLEFDFSRGPIPWRDVQNQLEYEGANPEVFFNEVDSL